MTPEQFCYWLNGYSEAAGDAPDGEQWKMIRAHLQLVFNKSPITKKSNEETFEEMIKKSREIAPDNKNPYYFNEPWWVYLERHPLRVTC